MPKCAVLRIQDVEPKPTFSYPEGLWMGDGQGACRTSALENSKVLFGNFTGSTCGMTQAPLARKTHLSLVPTKTENQDSAKVLPFSKGTYRTFSSQELDQETGLYYFGARYYDPRTSVFQSVDPDLDKFIPGKDFDSSFIFTGKPHWEFVYQLPSRGGILNPVNLNLYSYVGQNPVLYTDPDGRSYLVFDGSMQTISLYSKNGQRVGVWSAANHVDNTRSIGQLVNGSYFFKDTAKPYKGGAKGEYTENGSVGPGGIFRLQDFTGADQKVHTDVGVHAGESSKGGYKHATYGCVRSVDDAIKQIAATASKDPLTTLTVQNNRVNPNPPIQQAPQPVPSSQLSSGQGQ